MSQVVFLAGGLGTRLRPITEKIPKPLVEVASRPFLDWQLLEIQRQGFNRALLLIGYLGEQVIDYYKKNPIPGMELEYSLEEEPLGTGGALRNAVSKLDSTFIVMNADSFLRAPLALMMGFHRHHQMLATMSLFSDLEAVPVPANVKIQQVHVTDYRKGAGANSGFTHVDSGIYVLNRQLIESMSQKKFQLEDLWEPLISRRNLGGFRVNERFYDIGTPERLKLFEERLSDYFPNSIST